MNNNFFLNNGYFIRNTSKTFKQSITNKNVYI